MRSSSKWTAAPDIPDIVMSDSNIGNTAGHCCRPAFLLLQTTGQWMDLWSTFSATRWSVPSNDGCWTRSACRRSSSFPGSSRSSKTAPKRSIRNHSRKHSKYDRGAVPRSYHFHCHFIERTRFFYRPGVLFHRGFPEPPHPGSACSPRRYRPARRSAPFPPSPSRLCAI